MSDRTLIQEITKQAGDQSLHLLMTAVPVWLSQFIFGTGWLGLVAGYAFAAIREYSQWPSSRPWDPPLDWVFLLSGGIIAMWALPLEISIMETTAIDISPLLEQVLLLLGVVLAAVASWAGKKLSDKLGLEKESEARKYVQEALQRGISYAIKEARKRSENIKDPKVENKLVADAANYAITHVPDGLRLLKLDPVRDRARIEEIIRARLPD